MGGGRGVGEEALLCLYSILTFISLPPEGERKRREKKKKGKEDKER